MNFNTLLFEYSSVGDLKAFFSGTGASTGGSSTPMSGYNKSATPLSTVTGTAPPSDNDLFSDSKVDFQRALEIISEESGVMIEDLTDDTNFADAGVDSLLSLVIVSRYRDELGLGIQHESLFLECPTVADLKLLLLGNVAENPAESRAPVAVTISAEQKSSIELSGGDKAALAVHKEAADKYIQQYLTGWSPPSSSPSAPAPQDNEKVVSVTSASGSLGGHSAYHLAHLPDVNTVVCLKRENKAEGYVRQCKAMREKGIRYPESLKHKLLVLQTDTAKPRFGLSDADYEGLIKSVTYLIHNAWPMNAKRALPGFESQFQVMRNLIDFSWPQRR